MAIPQLFDWKTARAALNAGQRVRRKDWLERWMVRWRGGIIWLIFNEPGPPARVVRNVDFGDAEFRALDWTTLPAECVTGGTTPGSGVNGCPLPFDPEHPVPPPPPPFPPGPTPSYPGVPGGGGGKTDDDPLPSIDIRFTDASSGAKMGICYPMDSVQAPTFNATLTMTSPAGTTAFASWRYAVTHDESGRTVRVGSISPGQTRTFQVTMTAAAPGTQFHFRVICTQTGKPDLTDGNAATLRHRCTGGCDDYQNAMNIFDSCGQGNHHQTCFQDPQTNATCCWCASCAVCGGSCSEAGNQWEKEACENNGGTWNPGGHKCANPECENTCCIPAGFALQNGLMVYTG